MYHIPQSVAKKKKLRTASFHPVSSPTEIQQRTQIQKQKKKKKFLANHIRIIKPTCKCKRMSKENELNLVILVFGFTESREVVCDCKQSLTRN